MSQATKPPLRLQLSLALFAVMAGLAFTGIVNHGRWWINVPDEVIEQAGFPPTFFRGLVILIVQFAAAATGFYCGLKLSGARAFNAVFVALFALLAVHVSVLVLRKVPPDLQGNWWSIGNVLWLSLGLLLLALIVAVARRTSYFGKAA